MTLITILVGLAILIGGAAVLTLVLGYTFDQVKKSLLALTVFVATAVAYVLHFDPTFATGVEVLLGGIFAVVGVFLAPQFSAADLSKSLTYATGALFSVLKFFGIENASVETEIFTLIGLGATAFGVWWTANAGHRTPLNTINQQ